MITKHTDNAFAVHNRQDNVTTCRRITFWLLHKVKNKRTASYLKQPFLLANFSPSSTMTVWTGRKCIRIIIKSDYFSAFYAFVTTLSGFFSCCVHKINIKRLITSFIAEFANETFLATLFCWTNFNFLCYSCRRSLCSFFRWDKLPTSCISNSCRCFTHNIVILNSTIRMKNRDKSFLKNVTNYHT